MLYVPYKILPVRYRYPILYVPVISTEILPIQGLPYFENMIWIFMLIQGRIRLQSETIIPDIIRSGQNSGYASDPDTNNATKIAKLSDRYSISNKNLLHWHLTIPVRYTDKKIQVTVVGKFLRWIFLSCKQSQKGFGYPRFPGIDN